MNQEEYEQMKQMLSEEKITSKTVLDAPYVKEITNEDMDKMMAISENIITDEKKEEILNEEEEKEAKTSTLQKFGGETLSKVPELADFLRSEEHLRLGTHARIPVPLEVDGNPVKVFIRPLSRKELIECRNDAANKGHNDVDYEAVLKVCSTADGTPYTEKELSLLGYGHIQTIAEAIIIASGESPENTQTALRERMVDEFLEKFTTQTSR